MEQGDVATGLEASTETGRQHPGRPGPVAPRPASRARLRPLALDEVALDPAGQLGAWQRVNRDVTLPHCIAHVEERGNLDNLRRVTGSADGDFRGLPFADSDVYKTLEAAGWELARGAQPALDDFVDETTRLLADVQEDDGYLNSYYQGVHPDRKLRDFHWGHEMYCAGHLLQAAVAVARSTGRSHLLTVATRLADLLVRRFGAAGEEAIDGHPEIETALVELYRVTNEPAYLELATRFVELRGRGLLGPDRFGANYFQDHAPVREATEPTGHAVRHLPERRREVHAAGRAREPAQRHLRLGRLRRARGGHRRVRHPLRRALPVPAAPLRHGLQRRCAEGLTMRVFCANALPWW
jgi:uncharacterized protein